VVEQQDHADDGRRYAQPMEKPIWCGLVALEPTIQSLFETHSYIIRIIRALHKG